MFRIHLSSPARCNKNEPTSDVIEYMISHFESNRIKLYHCYSHMFILKSIKSYIIIIETYK